MKVTEKIRRAKRSTLQFSEAVYGPPIWNGVGLLSAHRRIGASVSVVAALASLGCLLSHHIAGAALFALLSWSVLIAATVCWWLDRRDAVRLFGTTKSAQECVELIVTEMNHDHIAFDEEQLAESVATVLLQQNLDLLGFVDAKVAHSHEGIYHVIGSAQCRSGQTVEFMGKLRLWWSTNGRVHCDSLGMVWH